MKKIILIIAATLVASTTWAQSQVQTVKGKTKDGKSINVQYIKGAGQDYIESVKYQLVDELKADNQKKQNSINDLQYQLNKANKKIDNLEAEAKKSGNASQNSNMQEQLNQKQSEIDALNARIEALNQQLNEANAENDRLRTQLDSVKAVNRQLSLNKRKSKTPVIGVEAGMGTVLMSANKLNDAINNPWTSKLSWDKQVDIYFGTGQLTESFPLSIEAGLGFRSLPVSAIIKDQEFTNLFDIDCDGTGYQSTFAFDNYTEKLTLTCLEIPVRFCIGQPKKDKVSLYAKVGVSPSFVLSSKLANGNYTKQGYYKDWNVTFEDIDELGFFNNGGADTQAVSLDSKFNLWANAAFGAYFPLSSSLLFNVGAKLEYPIMKSFNAKDGEELRLPNVNGMNHLTGYKGGLFVPNLQAGIVYTLN